MFDVVIDGLLMIHWRGRRCKSFGFHGILGIVFVVEFVMGLYCALEVGRIQEVVALWDMMEGIVEALDMVDMLEVEWV